MTSSKAAEYTLSIMEQFSQLLMRSGKKTLALDTINKSLRYIRDHSKVDKQKVASILITYGQGMHVLPPPPVGTLKTDNPHYTISSSLAEKDISPAHVLAAAVLKAAPLVHNSSVRGSSKVIQVPVPLSDRKRLRYGILWLLKAADKKKGAVHDRIAKECELILQGDSSDAIQRKIQSYRDAMMQKSNIIMMDRKIMPKR